VVTCEEGTLDLTSYLLPLQTPGYWGRLPWDNLPKQKEPSIEMTLGGEGSCYAILFSILQPMNQTTNCAIIETKYINVELKIILEGAIPSKLWKNHIHLIADPYAYPILERRQLEVAKNSSTPP
jgi:hypothetical protein